MHDVCEFWTRTNTHHGSKFSTQAGKIFKTNDFSLLQLFGWRSSRLSLYAGNILFRAAAFTLFPSYSILSMVRSCSIFYFIYGHAYTSTRAHESEARDGKRIKIIAIIIIILVHCNLPVTNIFINAETSWHFGSICSVHVSPECRLLFADECCILFLLFHLPVSSVYLLVSPFGI